MRFSSHFVAFVAFRVSRFVFAFLVSLWHLWQKFSRYAYVFLVSLWHFDDDQKLYKMDFFKMACNVQDGVQDMCRCCAKMVAVQDAVQDGVQDVMQDDWRA